MRYHNESQHWVKHKWCDTHYIHICVISDATNIHLEQQNYVTQLKVQGRYT